MTQLGKKLAGAVQTPAPTVKTSLGAFLARGPRGELRDIPGLGRVWLQVIGSEIVDDIEEAVCKRMKDRGFEPNVLHGLTYDAARARYTLTHAAREEGDHSKPLGTLEEWNQVDPDTIAIAWQIYADVRARLSPLDVIIDPAVRAEILDAISKKNGTLLRSLDACTLASFLITTEFQLASSPTTTSSDGDLSPAP